MKCTKCGAKLKKELYFAPNVGRRFNGFPEYNTLETLIKQRELKEQEKRKKELCRICHLLYQKDLVTATDGNVSMQTEEGFILLTPSGKHKGMLEPEEILVLDGDGAVREGSGRPQRSIPCTERSMSRGRR